MSAQDSTTENDQPAHVVGSGAVFCAEPQRHPMKTADKILEGIRAREAGKNAAKEGRKIDANPHQEESELHWQWLDSWCVEKSAMNRQNAKCSHLWGMTRGKLKPTKDMDEETDTQTTTDQPQRLATTLCSPSSFIAEVLRKDEAAVDELKTLVPEYTPPDEYAALHTRGKQALETLDEMTSLLRSAICICERQGTATNWEGFAASIRKLGLSGVTARTYRQANAEVWDGDPKTPPQQ